MTCKGPILSFKLNFTFLKMVCRKTPSISSIYCDCDKCYHITPQTDKKLVRKVLAELYGNETKALHPR